MQETTCSQEDPLEKEKAPHSSILAWEISWTEESLVGYSPWSCKSRTQLSNLGQYINAYTPRQS